MCIGNSYLIYIRFLEFSEKCPITSIKVTDASHTITKEYSEESFKIRGNYRLYYSRNTTDYPLSELRTVEGNGVCFKKERPKLD